MSQFQNAPGPSNEEFASLSEQIAKVRYETINLKNLSYTQSGQGMYYADTGITVTGTILAISIEDFSSLRATDVITPYFNHVNNRIGVMSNVNSFAASQPQLMICILYRS